jgi:hypothetical protein
MEFVFPESECCSNNAMMSMKRPTASEETKRTNSSLQRSLLGKGHMLKQVLLEYSQIFKLLAGRAFELA